MRKRCRSARILGVARLLGYRLGFTRYSSGWEGGVADVILEPGAEVWGLLYEIDDDDLMELDGYESYPNAYTRFQVSVQIGTRFFDGTWVYSVVDKVTFVPPTAKYLDILIEAAARWKFSGSYSEQLKKILVEG